MSVEKLQTVITEYEEIQKRLTTQVLEAIKEAFNDVFIQYPELTSFSWTQYTPYFNDGEPCEFSYNGISSFKEGEEDDSYEIHEDFLELEKIDSLLDQLPEFIMRGIFGDDSHVEVTRGDITITDYSRNHE